MKGGHTVLKQHYEWYPGLELHLLEYKQSI